MLLYQTILIYYKTNMEICKFVEGSFIPALDGASERFSQVSKNLAKQGAGLTVVHCYRGWSDLAKIAEQGFATYAISPKYYYQDYSVAESIIERVRPDVIEMNDIELIMSTGVHLSKRYKIPLVFDAQFVTSVLLQDLNAAPDVIEAERNQEQALGKVISGAICFTELDKKQFVDATGIEESRAHIIPLGSDTTTIKPRELKDSDKTVVFIGNMFYEPNSEAVEYAAENIIPAVTAANPGVNFRFVGDAPQHLKDKYQGENTVFTGRIQDINEVFDGARICIAPIKTGGGMRVKILTYMATGAPVVATSVGSEGISDLNAIRIGDTASDFIEQINAFLNDLPGSIELGRRARDVVARDHSWENIARDCMRLYSQVVGNPVFTDLAPVPVLREPFWLSETIEKGRHKRHYIDPESINAIGYGYIQRMNTRGFLS